VNHDDLQSLLGAYALDAIDADEEPALRVHLAECPRCRSEVAAHRQTAALLGNIGGAAPADVWERIASELALENASWQTSPLRAKVVPLSSWRRLVLPAVAALAAASVVLIGMLGVATIRVQHRVDVLRSMASAGGLQQAAAAAVLDPRHTTTRLSSGDGYLVAQVVIRPDGEAYLVNSDLPPLESAHTYQLWGLTGARVVSLVLLGTTPRLAAFRVDGAVSRLMVTAEPKGGTPRPTGPILIQGRLPATVGEAVMKVSWPETSARPGPDAPRCAHRAARGSRR
jgi:anti-sigma-K factor RskA